MLSVVIHVPHCLLIKCSNKYLKCKQPILANKIQHNSWINLPFKMSLCKRDTQWKISGNVNFLFIHTLIFIRRMMICEILFRLIRVSINLLCKTFSNMPFFVLIYLTKCYCCESFTKQKKTFSFACMVKLVLFYLGFVFFTPSSPLPSVGLWWNVYPLLQFGNWNYRDRLPIKKQFVSTDINNIIRIDFIEFKWKSPQKQGLPVKSVFLISRDKRRSNLAVRPVPCRQRRGLSIDNSTVSRSCDLPPDYKKRRVKCAAQTNGVYIDDQASRLFFWCKTSESDHRKIEGKYFIQLVLILLCRTKNNTYVYRGFLCHISLGVPHYDNQISFLPPLNCTRCPNFIFPQTELKISDG